MDAESDGTDLRRLTQGLDQRGLCLRILKLDSLNASLVVEIASILIVRDTFWETGLLDEVAGLLVQVLLEIGTNDNVHGCGLADLALMEAAVLVGLEHERTELREDAKLLVSNRDEVDCFGSE